jgi:hypothetical protein
LKNLRGSFDVAVMLPFYLRENAHRSYIDSTRIVKGKKIPKVVSRPDDWIYSDALGFTEMYEGILLAADTLRLLGLDINIHAFDIKGDTTDLSKMISRGILIQPYHPYKIRRKTRHSGCISCSAVQRYTPVG